MKYVKYVVMLGGVLGGLCSALAQTAAPAATDDSAPRQGAGQRGDGQGRGVERQIESLMSELALTDAQKESVKDSMTELRTKLRDARQENADAFRSAIEKMRAARDSGDEQAAAAAREELATLERDVMGPIWKTGTDNLRAVLTSEQQVKLDHWLTQRTQNAGQWRRGQRGQGQGGPGGGRGEMGVYAPRNVMAHAEALGLSDQQKQALQAAGQKIRAAMQSDEGARVEAIAAYRKEVETTLTPEQLAKLKELEPVRGRDRGNRPQRGNNAES